MSNYYEQLPLFPTFEIKINDEDGRIPVCRIESWKALSEVLNDDFFKQQGKELVFRGQEDYSWALTPSLGRLNHAGTIQTDIAEKQKELFRLSIRGRVEDSSLLEDEIELWALGQHNGLKTPLLDWTYSPYIALFFAYEKQDSLKDNEESRAIYVLNKKALEEIEKIENLEENLFVQPRRNDHVRLINQAGLFTISPRDTSDTLETYISKLLGDKAGVNMDNPDEVAYYICKIHIPNKDRTECLQHLRMMNIHHGSLFPDLMGSSQYCNELTQEHTVEIEKRDEKDKDEYEKHYKDIYKDFDVEDMYGIPEYDIHDICTYFESELEEEYGLSETNLNGFSDEIEKKILNNIAVDWENRASIIAKLKNIIRLELRKRGLAPDSLNSVSEYFVQELIGLERIRQKKAINNDV